MRVTLRGIALARPIGRRGAPTWTGGGLVMMTVATAARLKEGAEQEWDTVMSERFAAARKQTGWVGGQLLHPENQDDARTMVGTWRSKEDWAKWHEDPEFAETRERLDGLTRQKPQH